VGWGEPQVAVQRVRCCPVHWQRQAVLRAQELRRRKVLRVGLRLWWGMHQLQVAEHPAQGHQTLPLVVGTGVHHKLVQALRKPVVRHMRVVHRTLAEEHRSRGHPVVERHKQVVGSQHLADM